MKKDQFSSLKGMDQLGLAKKVKELKLEIADLAIDKNTKKLKDLKQISKKKKEVAQIMTVIRQKQLLEQLEKGAQE